MGPPLAHPSRRDRTPGRPVRRAARHGPADGRAHRRRRLARPGVLRPARQVRIKDVDFDQGMIVVRGGTGAKDRSTLLAETAREHLRAHLEEAEALYRTGRAATLAGVWLPEAVERKSPHASRELGWFWVFPSHALSTDPRAGIVGRHHLHESVIQKAVKVAAEKAKTHKPVSVPSSVRGGSFFRATWSTGSPRGTATAARARAPASAQPALRVNARRAAPAGAAPSPRLRARGGSPLIILG